MDTPPEPDSAYFRSEIAKLESRVFELETELHDARIRAWDPLERAMFQNLMDHAPDAIYFKDLDSHFLRVSRHMAQKHNPDGNPRLLIGKTDADFFTAEHAEQTRIKEKYIVASGETLVDEQEHEIWTDGRDSWCSSTKLPLKDEQGETIGTFGVSRDITRRKHLELEKDALISQLKQALGQIKALDGLLPICSNCKKIRDDDGYWKQLEEYISEHSEARFTHSVCGTCKDILYPGLDTRVKKKPAPSEDAS